MWSLVYVGVPIFTHLHTVTNIWIAKTEQQIINIQRGVDIFFVRNISATAAHMHIFPAILKAVEKTSNECFFLYLIKNSLSGALDEKSLIIYWKTCTHQQQCWWVSPSCEVPCLRALRHKHVTIQMDAYSGCGILVFVPHFTFIFFLVPNQAFSICNFKTTCINMIICSSMQQILF